MKQDQMLFSPNPRGKPRYKNLGYGTPTRARHTLRRIRKEPLSYQHQVATTMYYRAKHHKYQTRKMRESMKIYKQFLDSIHNPK